MQYHQFKDLQLSQLGMGAMRLPQTEPGFAKLIDEPKAMELIDCCISHGVNYFDTAYIYHMGQSEVLLGKALKRYPRDSFCVADKFNVQAEPDYPIWWGDAPKIISTFLESYDFDGKTIVPFCTSGSSSIGGSVSDLEALTDGATWLEGQRFSGTASQETISQWVDSLDLDLGQAA